MRTSDFLGSIADDKLLSHITIPGSHDAGVYAGDAKGIGPAPKSGAVCQHGGMMDQCRAGSRFFDLRLLTHKGSSVAHHSRKVLGARLGATGGALEKMMGELMAFVSARPSEFVIARFTKCKDHGEIVKTIRDMAGDYLLKGGGNIAKRRLGDVRGKIITVFDEEFDKHLAAGAGIHPFYRYPQVANHGLSTCGKYAGTTNIYKVYVDQIEKLQSHDAHEPTDDHLNVLYWTQTSATGGNILKMTKSGSHETMERGLADIRDRLKDARHGDGNAFIKNRMEIKDKKMARLRSGLKPPTIPNVVMYDFVNPASSVPIIALNWPDLRFAGK